MHKQKILSILFLVMLATVSLSSYALAQTDSLTVWENIANGTLTSTWVENETVDWKPQNDSGIWEYNCTVQTDVSFTYNDTLATRWFQTFEVTADNAETGIGSAMVHNLTAYYAIVYYYDSTDHNPNPAPSAHLMCYDTDHFDYWNGTGFESNETNATDLGQLWEKDYTGGFFRVKVMWDFYSTIGCSLHFKLWDPSGDEYPLWMVDLEFPQHPSMTYSSYKPGLFVDSRYDLDPSETDFRRIFFWNTTYDLYPPILPIVNNYIRCPTLDAYDAYFTYVDYTDLDDIWNETQALKDIINLWDLQVMFTEEHYDPADNVNDSIYHFSIMMTDTRDLFGDMFGPLPDDFPDNILMMNTYLCPDASGNESDYMLLRIDTDNNGDYDSYDYAIWSNDTNLITYQGWTPFDDPWFCMMYSGPALPGNFGEIFRDDMYYEYYTTINWDKVYNGSSGERVGDDLCRMSIGWYNNDTDAMSLLQDYDRTDDDSPYPATDGHNSTRDPTWEEYNISSNWVYFQVDESISGEPMADPNDPASIYDDLSPMTVNLLQVILPIMLAVAIFILIVNMALTGGITKESLITLMIVAIIGIIVIQIILGL